MKGLFLFRDECPLLGSSRDRRIRGDRITLIYFSHESMAIWKGNSPILSGLTITMVINHILTGKKSPLGNKIPSYTLFPKIVVQRKMTIFETCHSSFRAYKNVPLNHDSGTKSMWVDFFSIVFPPTLQNELRRQGGVLKIETKWAAGKFKAENIGGGDDTSHIWLFRGFDSGPFWESPFSTNHRYLFMAQLSSYFFQLLSEFSHRFILVEKSGRFFLTLGICWVVHVQMPER